MLKHIKNSGIEAIAKRCDYNLRSIRMYFKRECNVKNASQLAYIMKLFKNYLKTRRFTLKAKLYIEEILRKIKE